MNMKKFTAAAIASASLLCQVSVSAVTVEINGAPVYTPAMIINDRTMIPLREVSNALGCGVAWDADNRGIVMYRYPESGGADSTAICWIERGRAFCLKGMALDKAAVLEAPPIIENDLTYVPLRAVSELFGAQVSWDSETQTASVVCENVPAEYSDESAAQLLVYEKALLAKYDAYSGYADGSGKTVRARIELENGGTISLELYPDLAPETVSNFVKLAQSGYYDGTLFHRVIKDFMIQGGGFDESGAAKNTGSVKGEFIANGFLNLIPHTRGTVSMARANDYNSASGQFFITHADSRFLDGMYAPFGRVTEGMEYVDRIADAATDESDKPLVNQTVSTVKIIE